MCNWSIFCFIRIPGCLCISITRNSIIRWSWFLASSNSWNKFKNRKFIDAFLFRSFTQDSAIIRLCRTHCNCNIIKSQLLASFRIRFYALTIFQSVSLCVNNCNSSHDWGSLRRAHDLKYMCHQICKLNY